MILWELSILLFFFLFLIDSSTSGPLTIIQNLNFSAKRRIFICASDTPQDAIALNADSSIQTSAVTEKNLTQLLIRKECNKVSPVFADCNDENYTFNWRLTNSIENPMGPVFDSRWEKFENSQLGLVLSTQNGWGSFVVSIKGKADAEFLMCREYESLNNFCYWIIIGHSEKNFVSIKRCPSSLDNCNTDTTRTEYDLLDPFEWKTFLIEWDGSTQRIHLYDPYKKIVTYRDPVMNKTSGQHKLHVYHRHSVSSPMIRFHMYNYMFTNKTSDVLSNSKFTYNSETFCINFLAGLCATCTLLVKVFNENQQKLHKFTIKANTSREIDYDLPQWQFVRLEENFRERIKFYEITTGLSEHKEDVKKHWAVAKIEQCLPDGYLKIIGTFNTGSNNGVIKCQRLSYDKANEEVVDNSKAISKPPEDIAECPTSQSGPKCAFQCHKIGKNTCQSIGICNKSYCHCAAGWKGNSCSQQCSINEYGLGCGKRCGMCNGICHRTGRCSQCYSDNDVYYIPPYCKIKIEKPAAPIILNVNFTTVEFEDYLQSYPNISYDYSVIIASWDNQSDHRTLKYDGIIDTISNLTAGTSYGVKIEMIIHNNKKIKKIFTGDTSNFTTLCDALSFKFEIGSRGIYIFSTSESNSTNACPINWYSIEVYNVINEYYINFELNEYLYEYINKLTPFTNYTIKVRGKNDYYSEYNITTKEDTPTAVNNLTIKNITSTSVRVSWDQPNEINGKFKEFIIEYKVTKFRGCDKYKNEKYLNDYGNKMVIKNLIYETQLNDLNPFSEYQLKISIANSEYKSPVSSIQFETLISSTPTTSFSDFTYSQETKLLSWRNPEDCWKISNSHLFTGIRVFDSKHNRIFNEYIYGTTYNISNEMLNLNGSEVYTIRIYVSYNGSVNEELYQELQILSPVKAPPKVRNLTVVEVNQNVTVKWLKPLPPIHGEIEYYLMYTKAEEQLGVKIYPNSTCFFDPEWICGTILSQNENSDIVVSAYNYNFSKSGQNSSINYKESQKEPEAPQHLEYELDKNGKINLTWKHPLVTGRRVNKFQIKINILSTDLLNYDELDDNFLNVEINKYARKYKMKFDLLPSTTYNISVRGITVENKKGKLSRPLLVTTESAAEFANEPSVAVNSKMTALKLNVPEITNGIHDSSIKIFIKGKLNCINSDGIDSDKFTLISDLPTYNLSESTFVIGTVRNDNKKEDTADCLVITGNSYKVKLIYKENKPDGKRLMWQSKSLQIGSAEQVSTSTSATPVLWSISVVVIILVILMTIFTYIRKKRYQHQDQNIVSINQAAQKELLLNNELKTLRGDDLSLSTGKKRGINEDLTIKIINFRDYVKNAVKTGALEEQYARFPRGATKSWDYGFSPNNKMKNRYANLAAYDETRVILSKLPNDESSDYINANYIEGINNNKKAYIATQGPKPNTVEDFWRMVWQENVQVICMVANVTEGGKKKCEQYWPDIGKRVTYGEISISNVNHNVFADFTFRTFYINKGETDRRTVKHFHYTSWPDHGVPLSTHSIVSYLKKLLTVSTEENPVLVHCSAGVGRTGTIILSDICLRQSVIKNEINVFAELEKIRNQRANMVDNKLQYLLVHLIIIENLLSLPTSITCDNSLKTNIKEFKEQVDVQRKGIEEFLWHDEALKFISKSNTSSLSKEHLGKIRYNNLAYDTHIYIDRYPTTDSESYYVFGVRIDGVQQTSNYIATQLPLPNTLGDFWRMIYQHNVEIIILLQPPDVNDSTCCKFIPERNEEIQPVPFLTVKGQSITNTENYTQHQLILSEDSEEAKKRHLKVFTCKSWEAGPHKPPPKPQVLVDLWDSSQRIIRSEHPTVILCHDGVTNCGLYAAMSYLLERMGLERECDVSLAVRAVKRSRPDFCTNSEQFKYLYDCAAIYSTYFDFYANFD